MNLVTYKIYLELLLVCLRFKEIFTGVLHRPLLFHVYDEFSLLHIFCGKPVLGCFLFVGFVCCTSAYLCIFYLLVILFLSHLCSRYALVKIFLQALELNGELLLNREVRLDMAREKGSYTPYDR